MTWRVHDLAGLVNLEISPETLLALCVQAVDGRATSIERGANPKDAGFDEASSLASAIVANRHRIDDLALQRLSIDGTEETNGPKVLSIDGSDSEQASTQTVRVQDLMRATTAGRLVHVDAKTIARHVPIVEIDGRAHFLRPDVEEWARGGRK